MGGIREGGIGPPREAVEREAEVEDPVVPDKSAEVGDNEVPGNTGPSKHSQECARGN